MSFLTLLGQKPSLVMTSLGQLGQIRQDTFDCSWSHLPPRYGNGGQVNNDMWV
jgi:hypothetical protein